MQEPGANMRPVMLQDLVLMSVLQRKARAGNEERQARSMTVPKSLRVGLAKAGDDLFDMALAVIGVTLEKISNDEVS